MLTDPFEQWVQRAFRKCSRYILIGGLSIYLSPAYSQNFIESEKLDPDKKAAIKELLAVTGAQANQQELTDSFTQQMVLVLQANGIQLNANALNAIRSEVGAVVKEQIENEALQRKMYIIYARYFSLEELNELVAFNRTSIGVKANRVMPILMRESMGAAQQWSEEMGPIMSSRVLDRLKSEGINLKN